MGGTAGIIHGLLGLDCLWIVSSDVSACPLVLLTALGSWRAQMQGGVCSCQKGRVRPFFLGLLHMEILVWKFGNGLWGLSSGWQLHHVVGWQVPADCHWWPCLMPELWAGGALSYLFSTISSCCARNRKKYLLLAIGLRRSGHLLTAFNLQFVSNLCPDIFFLFFPAFLSFEQ